MGAQHTDALPRPNCPRPHSLRLHTQRQPRSPHDQSQARHHAENTMQLYSQSGELRRALEKQFWKDLQLILVQTPKTEEKKERVSRGHYSESSIQTPVQSINQHVLGVFPDCSSWDPQHLSGVFRPAECVVPQVGDGRRRSVRSKDSLAIALPIMSLGETPRKDHNILSHRPRQAFGIFLTMCSRELLSSDRSGM